MTDLPAVARPEFAARSEHATHEASTEGTAASDLRPPLVFVAMRLAVHVQAGYGNDGPFVAAWRAELW
jgi:hypothetical protein